MISTLVTSIKTVTWLSVGGAGKVIGVVVERLELGRSSVVSWDAKEGRAETEVLARAICGQYGKWGHTFRSGAVL